MPNRELLRSDSGIAVTYGDPEEPIFHRHPTATSVEYDNTAPGILHILAGSETIAIYQWQYVLSVRRLEVGEDDDKDEEEDEEDEEEDEDEDE